MNRFLGVRCFQHNWSQVVINVDFVVSVEDHRKLYPQASYVGVVRMSTGACYFVDYPGYAKVIAQITEQSEGVSPTAPN
jgi:hypothetical protein